MTFERLREVGRKDKDSNSCLQLPNEGYREEGCREERSCLFSEMYNQRTMDSDHVAAKEIPTDYKENVLHHDSG